MSNQPFHKNKFGKVNLVIWDGDYGKTVIIDKRYMDKKTNEWKSSTKFFENELPDLKLAVEDALRVLKLQDDAALENVNNVFNDEDIPF